MIIAEKCINYDNVEEVTSVRGALLDWLLRLPRPLARVEDTEEDLVRTPSVYNWSVLE